MGFDRAATSHPELAVVAEPAPLDEPPPTVRIRVHPGLCQGWGECHRWAPEVYPLDEDGRVDVHVLEVPGELALQAWIAARSCPEQAITFIGPPDEYWLPRLRHLHDR